MERLAPETIEVQYPETLRRLEVAWVDAEFSSGYKTEGNRYVVGLKNREIGFLVAETDAWLVLGSETWEETGAEESKGFRRTISIPKVNVVLVVELVPVTLEPTASSNIYTEVSIPTPNATHVLPLETVSKTGEDAEQLQDIPF